MTFQHAMVEDQVDEIAVFSDKDAFVSRLETETVTELQQKVVKPVE